VGPVVRVGARNEPGVTLLCPARPADNIPLGTGGFVVLLREMREDGRVEGRNAVGASFAAVSPPDAVFATPVLPESDVAEGGPCEERRGRKGCSWLESAICASQF
jgi:hypothetical protein